MSVREKVSSFDRKNLGALLIIGFVSLMFASQGLSQSSGTPDVSFGQNGIQINSGGLDTGGGDITDGSTTVWDASNSYVPATSVDQETIQSGTTASDVGLGNVLNKEQLAVDGTNSMNSNLDLSGNNIVNTEVISNTGNVQTSGTIFGSGETGIYGDNSPVRIAATDEIALFSDSDSTSGGSYSCTLSATDGTFNCEGTKSWIHDLENGSEAVYTSQESPEVRAVYEGKARVDGETKVELPSHYSKTVSDDNPMLRSTATVQGKLAYAAVIKKTDDYLILDSSKPATVNYRITGIRDGYEDKQVVREKEE